MALREFLTLPSRFIGMNFDAAKSAIPLTIARGEPWCAHFIRCIARRVGVEGTLISAVDSAAAMTKDSNANGRFHSGKNVTPLPGDIFWREGHVGIVMSVSGNTVTRIDGNTGGGSGNIGRQVLQRTNTIGQDATRNGRIVAMGYWRPNWAAAGPVPDDWDLDSDGNSGGNSHRALYDTHNTRHDATLREVGILNSQYEPSINTSTSRPKLLVVNYTSMLSAMFQSTGTDGGDPGDLEGNAREIAQYSLNKGLNRAAVAGILGNLEVEAGFNPSLVERRSGVDPITGACGGVGIVQWTNYPRCNSTGRRTNMQNAVPNWQTNLQGQIEYMWFELEGGYRNSTLTPLQNVPNTLDGAKTATDIVLHRFLIPCTHSIGSRSCNEFKNRWNGGGSRPSVKGAEHYFNSMN
jgi:hypothetical protein